jgi:glycosyltransferase involved in cell wall biosynthesis
MRVLHIMAAPGNGGAELYATDLMLSLHEAGLDQCVVMREHAPRTAELKAAGLHMETTILTPNLKPLQRQKLRRLIARENPTIIQCWMRRAASLIPITATCPTIGWFGDYEDLKHFSSCTHFAGVTPDLVSYMQAHGIPPSHTAYLPTFSSVTPEPPLATEQFGTPKDAKILLTLSRLHQTKGLDTLIQTLPSLPECHLWLAGEGPEKTTLKTLAETLGVAPRVKFLGWRTDRGALLRAATLCVLPSRYEPFGTVILDAWITETPLVACASAGPRASLTNGINGMLAPIDDPAALAAAIRLVLDSPALRETLITNGLANYQEKFSRQAVTAQYLAYYASLAGEARTTPLRLAS